MTNKRSDIDWSQIERDELPNTSSTKQELVTLSGKAVSIDGSFSKSKYFDFLDIDLSKYDDIELTPEEANRVSNYMRKLSTGVNASIPMLCAGPKCPMAHRCPLQQMNKAPIGRDCLIETQLIRQWLINYFEEFNVDPQNFTEVGYVNELAEIMTLEMRINSVLAGEKHSALLIEQIIGTDREGNTLIQKGLNPLLEYKQKLSERKSKVIKLMVGDRQEKYKQQAALKTKDLDDPSNKMAAIRNKLESIMRQVDGIDTSKQLADPANVSPQDLIDSPDE